MLQIANLKKSMCPFSMLEPIKSHTFERRLKMKRKEVKVNSDFARPKWVCTLVSEDGKLYLEHKRPNSRKIKVDITEDIKALTS